MAITDYHSFENGVRWRLTPKGVEIEGSGVERTKGAPKMVTKVWETYSEAINRTARARRVPCAIIIACICTESGGKAEAIRFEPGYKSDEETPGKVSPGLMQTLISTARATLQKSVDRAWLLKPENSIEAGTAYMAKQFKSTGFDPPLVGAAYNAGSLKKQDGSQNRWKLRQFPIGTGEHCDRFVRFFNDAIFVLAQHSTKPAVGIEELLRGEAPAPSTSSNTGTRATPAPAATTSASASSSSSGAASGNGSSSNGSKVVGASDNAGNSGGGSKVVGANESSSSSNGGATSDRSGVKISFGQNARPTAMTQYSMKVLEEILRSSQLASAIITSTSRTPAEQARVMYENLERQGVAAQKKLYGPYGDKVIDVYVKSKAAGRTIEEIKRDMEMKIKDLGPTNVSKHTADPRVLNVFDVAPSSIKDRRAFELAVKSDERVKKFLTPSDSDPAYHLEVPQPRW